MKKETKKEVVMTIEDATKLYATYARQEKEAKKSGEKYKKHIIDYAEANRAAFSGKTLDLANGVRVELRETIKATYNADSVTCEWLDGAIDKGLGDAVSVNIDAKKISKMALDADQDCLLEDIDFEIEVKETMAVCVND
jgi:hypothetical protein